MRHLHTVFACAACALNAIAYSGDTIYSIDNDASSDRIGRFDSDTPGSWTPLGVPTGQGGFINGLEFDGDGNLYGSNGVRLFAVNTSTGACTTIGKHRIGGRRMGGMGWDPTTGTMYGIDNDSSCASPSNLMSIDLGTGVATVICTHPLATCAVGLTFDSDGIGYVMDLTNDAIHATNLTSCVVERSQPLAYAANFGQDLSINLETSAGYITAFNVEGFGGEFWTWDPVTGAMDYIGNLGGTGSSQMAGADVDERPVELIPFPFLSYSGSCPGRLDVTVEHCTPFRPVTLVYGTQAQSWIVPNGVVCEGIELGIRKAKVARIVNADAAGVARFSGQVPSGACDNLLLQAVDLDSCETTNLTLVPEGDEIQKRCEARINCILKDPNGDCPAAVWNAIRNYPDKFVLSFATCSDADPCEDGGVKMKVGLNVKYRDATGAIWKCEVGVEIETTEAGCVQAVATPWKWTNPLPTGDCDADYTFN